MVVMSGCSDDSAWDEMPVPISRFVSRYFPGLGVSSFVDTGNTYNVQIRNEAFVSFDRAFLWITVDGKGAVLPEMFLFDQLPPVLYDHLQELSELDRIYSVSRSKSVYTVSLSDSVLIYDSRTGVMRRLS